MTAEVAILNKRGVALAADSAITIGRGKEKKVYNTGNKLFALSKRYPVGIMIYNSVEFMGVDWEIIIKRKNYFDINLNQHFLRNYFQEVKDEKSI